ncbi:MAG: sigma-70 family RNA polymerase sigma factor [Bacteroidia bacterium]|jgi:RNA polymerase sigma-70 factor (ECF subfamily)|nr:sigma-70 family RNA polymerase sigma factor [Bacteroidia bacterium]
MRLFPRKRTNDLSDQELMARYRKGGDKALVGELYNRYAHLVYGACLHYLTDRELARDAVLQIFERLFDSLRTQQPDNFGVWVNTVARNFCISELRKQQVQRGRDEAYAAETKADLLDDTDPEQREEQLKRLEQAVRSLGEEQRKCIELFYFGDKSYREIADLTGFSEKEVKSHLQNGKRNLKLALTGNR